MLQVWSPRQVLQSHSLPSSRLSLSQTPQSKWRRRYTPPVALQGVATPRRCSFSNLEGVAGVSQLQPPPTKGSCRTPPRTPCRVSRVSWTSESYRTETLSRLRGCSCYPCDALTLRPQSEGSIQRTCLSITCKGI